MVSIYSTSKGQIADMTVLGSDLRDLTTSVTQSLCDQIFTKPIHWTLATNFSETATHAIDFGPGGLSGIGPLTARNLEGRGVRTVVLGEKGRGGSEFYDSENVKFEQCWAKKYAPKLVKTRYGLLVLQNKLMAHEFSLAMVNSRLTLRSHVSWASLLLWSPE